MVHMTPFQQLQIRFLHARFPPRVTTGNEDFENERMEWKPKHEGFE